MTRQREWPKFPGGGGGIFEKFSARGVYQKYPLPPIPVAWLWPLRLIENLILLLEWLNRYLEKTSQLMRLIKILVGFLRIEGDEYIISLDPPTPPPPPASDLESLWSPSLLEVSLRGLSPCSFCLWGLSLGSFCLTIFPSSIRWL